MERMDELYKQMLSLREAVMAMFNGKDKSNLDDIVKVLEPEDKRVELELSDCCEKVRAIVEKHLISLGGLYHTL